MIGSTGQGIEPGACAELIAAIKAGRTYANVHSTKWPTGEIRSQIRDLGHDGRGRHDGHHDGHDGHDGHDDHDGRR